MLASNRVECCPERFQMQAATLRELWKGFKDKNPEFKPMFTESFLAMLKEYGLDGS